MTAEEIVEAQKLAVNWKPRSRMHDAESNATDVSA
jgi:hypothetical protein